MKIIFKTPDAMFNFSQKDVKEQIIKNQLLYDTDEVGKLLNLISTGNQDTIMIPDEPVFFDFVAMDLIGAGKGSIFCKACNKNYLSGHLIPTIVGFGGSPFDIRSKKKSVFSRLFSKKYKPPTMYGGRGYECPEGHSLISVIIWKTF